MSDADPELEQRLRSLETRLRTVEDVEAIRRLKARYGELVDDRYAGGRPREGAALAALADRIAGLFTEDAVWDGGAGLGECRGREAIRERFLKPTLHFSWHYFVKPAIQVDGDRAQGSWDILAPCTDRKGRALWMAGVENDEYARVGGIWLHSRMTLRTVFFAPHEEGWARPMEESRKKEEG